MLETGQWKTVIDRLWEVGVPQVVFTSVDVPSV
jgi:hypothetical protein